MQALVPPPSSTGLDYTQRLQSRTVELEAELAAIRRRLNFQKKLVDALGVLSDRNMEVTRLDLALKDTDEEVASLKERLDLEAVTLSNALRAVSARDIEIERLTFALKDKDNELESVRDEHRTQIDELMEEIERLTRRNKKPFKVAELRDSIYKQQQSIDALWNYVKSIAAHINTGSSQENPR